MPTMDAKFGIAPQHRKKICILGVTGYGKSTLGNIFLGKDPNAGDGFKTSGGAKGCTWKANAVDGLWLGTGDPIRVIDTPGHGDSQDRDEKLRKKMVDCLKSEECIDVFVWVKDSGNPRYNGLEKTYFEILLKMFGPTLFSNLVVVFSKWRFDQKSEKVRRKKGVTLESTKIDFWNSFAPGCVDIELPIVALDAFYDEDDPEETEAFQREVELLWEHVKGFSAVPVDRIEVARSKLEEMKHRHDDLLKEQEELRKREREREDWKKIEDELRERQAKLEKEIKEQRERMQGPPWLKFVTSLAEALRDVVAKIAEGLETVRQELQEYISSNAAKFLK